MTKFQRQLVEGIKKLKIDLLRYYACPEEEEQALKYILGVCREDMRGLSKLIARAKEIRRVKE